VPIWGSRQDVSAFGSRSQPGFLELLQCSRRSEERASGLVAFCAGRNPALIGFTVGTAHGYCEECSLRPFSESGAITLDRAAIGRLSGVSGKWRKRSPACRAGRQARPYTCADSLIPPTAAWPWHGSSPPGPDSACSLAHHPVAFSLSRVAVVVFTFATSVPFRSSPIL
jgi:hypothetical protein